MKLLETAILAVAILAAAFIISGAIESATRWEISTNQGEVHRLDRRTGSVTLCRSDFAKRMENILAPHELKCEQE